MSLIVSTVTAPPSRIVDLHTHAGTSATVRGWVTHVRSSGKVAFIVMRDGTGTLQAVVVKNAVAPDVWARFGGELQSFVDAGCLRHEGDGLRLTREGMLIAHEVMAVFV